MAYHSIPWCREWLGVKQLVPRSADGEPDLCSWIFGNLSATTLAHAPDSRNGRNGFQPEYRASVSGVLALEQMSEYNKLVGPL